MITHDELVEKAAKWLLNYGCSVVITELSSISNETPDAIGFIGGGSVLIECKTNVNDFKRDKVKFFRHYPDFGMGSHRYFLTPSNLIDKNQLPNDWGLLELRNTRIATVLKSGLFKRNEINEIKLLTSFIRRYDFSGMNGARVKSYKVDSEKICKAKGFIVGF